MSDNDVWSASESDDELDAGPANVLEEEEVEEVLTFDDDMVYVQALQENGKWKTHVRGLHKHLANFRVKTMNELLSVLKKSVCKTGGCLRYPEDDEDVEPFIVLQGDHGAKLREYILKNGIRKVKSTGGR